MTSPDWKARVHPELRGTLRKMPNFTFGPFSTRAFRLLTRLAPIPKLEHIETTHVRLGAQDLWCFAPQEGPRIPGALLWLHGGGRILGNPKTDAWHCARIARSIGVTVVASSYRVGPEHPFPAALDDAHAAWRWTLENATELGIEPERIVIGGESAGGGLAAELGQRLYDEGGAQPCGQLLLYPMLDDRTAADADLTAQKHLVWNNASNHYGWSSYLGQPPGEAQVPRYASASRREDLSGLPRAWVHVGELDLFEPENRRYAERLRAAGVDVEFELGPGAFHGYYAPGRTEPPIQALHTSMDRFLVRCLGTPGD